MCILKSNFYGVLTNRAGKIFKSCSCSVYIGNGERHLRLFVLKSPSDPVSMYFFPIFAFLFLFVMLRIIHAYIQSTLALN